jgi:DeoR family transcriptional regulator of aga operon
MAADGAELPVAAGERRDQMLAVIKQRDFIRVGELSERFGVSEVTIRSDLDALASRGEVHRIHGGAIPRTVPERERPFEESETSFADEKLAIGHAAAQLVRDGEALLVDVGTTTAAAARALTARTDVDNITVFTNGLKTALELEAGHPRITVVLLGGTLRPLQHSLVDPMATLILDQIHVHTLLLGCNGVDPVGGVTNMNLPEAEVKRRMLAAAGRRVVLADGGKIGRVELAHLCPVDQIDIVITGESADPAVVEALRKSGCEVRVVS